MSRNRLLLVIAIVVTLVVVALGIIGIISSNKKNEITPQTTQAITPASMTIDNFAKDTGIYTATVQKSIESAIVARITLNTSLTGHVRTGSLKVTPLDTTKNTRFIVDIPDIKRSYVVSLGEDSSTGEQSLYILCLSAEEMIYPSFNCKDSAA